MTKQQMVGATCAGVFVVCVGALGWFLYDAASVRAEKEEQLQEGRDRYTGYKQAVVYPSVKSIAAVKSNETSYVEWCNSALQLAARGDRAPAVAEEPSVFKQRLQAEVRRMAALPGGVDGKICAAGFLFGFEQYLGESGVLPKEADVPRLATQLDTIAHMVDMFADSGVYEVKMIQRVEPRADDDEDALRNKKAAKGKNAKGAKADEGEDGSRMTSLEYKLDFTVRPSAFVKVFNAFTADVRFCVVKDLSFKQTSDSIVDRLSAVEAAAAQAVAAEQAASNMSRRRRRRAAAEEEQQPTAAAEKKVDRIVSDPETDAPVDVNLTLVVYDFGLGTQPKPVAEQLEQTAEKKEEK